MNPDDNTDRGNAEPTDGLGSSALVAVTRRALPLLIGLTVVLGVYAGALDAPFLWDDLPLLEAPSVKELMPPWKYLTVAFWGNAEEASVPRFYRPIVTLSLAIDQAIHGSNAMGFHLTNVLLHLVNVGLLYKLARRCSARPVAASVAATLWGILPRLTESVAWISGRTDELCTMFTLLAWLVYDKHSFRRAFTASGLVFLALLSKEAGVAGIFAICCCGLTLASARSRVLSLAPVVALTATYAILRTSVLGGSEAFTVVLTPTERGLTVIEAVGRYAYMVIDPWHPEAQIGAIKSPHLGFVGFGVTVLCAGLGFGLWAFRRRTLRRPSDDTLFGIVSIVVPLLLVIHLVPLPWIAVVGDRLLYLPLAAAAVLLAPYLNGGVIKNRVLTGILGVLAVSFAVTTRARTHEYANSAEFWVRALETTEAENWGPEINLATELFRAGLFEHALNVVHSVEQRADPTGLQRVLNLDPTHIAALASLGRYEEASRVANEVAAVGQTAELQLTKARLLANQGRIADAITLGLKVQSSHPQYAEADTFIIQMRRVNEHVAAANQEVQKDVTSAVQGARLLTELGRTSPAAQAWLRILAEPEVSSQVREEAFAFLIAFAAYEDMSKGAQLYVAQGGEAMLPAFDERDRNAKDLIRLIPRIEQALQEKLKV